MSKIIKFNKKSRNQTRSSSNGRNGDYGHLPALMKTCEDYLPSYSIPNRSYVISFDNIPYNTQGGELLETMLGSPVGQDENYHQVMDEATGLPILHWSYNFGEFPYWAWGPHESSIPYIYITGYFQIYFCNGCQGVPYPDGIQLDFGEYNQYIYQIIETVMDPISNEPIPGEWITRCTRPKKVINEVTNVQDLVMLVNLILNEVYTNEMILNLFPFADVNGDGVVDIVDVMLLINMILGNTNLSSGERNELQKQLQRLRLYTTVKENYGSIDDASNLQSLKNILKDKLPANTTSNITQADISDAKIVANHLKTLMPNIKNEARIIWNEDNPDAMLQKFNTLLVDNGVYDDPEPMITIPICSGGGYGPDYGGPEGGGVGGGHMYGQSGARQCLKMIVVIMIIVILL